MSINVFITRREGNPLDEVGPEIALQDWRSVLSLDPSFRAASPEDYTRLELPVGRRPEGADAIWTSHPEHPEVWFCLRDGSLEISGPDELIIVKMLEVAKRLGAMVVSETGEVFNEDGSHRGFVDGEPW